MKKGYLFLTSISFGKKKNVYLLSPLHPKIRINILYTALHTFPKVPTRRICLPIMSFFRW